MRCCHPALAYRVIQSDTAVNGRMPKCYVDQRTVRFQAVDFLRSRSELASPSPMNHEMAFHFVVLLTENVRGEPNWVRGVFGDSQSAIRFRLEETSSVVDELIRAVWRASGQRSELPHVSSLNAAVEQQRLITAVQQYLTNCLQSHLRRLPCSPLSSIL